MDGDGDRDGGRPVRDTAGPPSLHCPGASRKRLGEAVVLLCCCVAVLLLSLSRLYCSVPVLGY